VGATRTLYEHQQFNFAGSYGENGWLEDYTAQVRDEPIGRAVLVTRNAAGQTQHVAANYRPRASLLLLSRLVGGKLAGTPQCQVLPRPQVLRRPSLDQNRKSRERRLINRRHPRQGLMGRRARRDPAVAFPRVPSNLSRAGHAPRPDEQHRRRWAGY
jgi:hypothetical protein